MISLYICECKKAIVNRASLFILCILIISSISFGGKLQQSFGEQVLGINQALEISGWQSVLSATAHSYIFQLLFIVYMCARFFNGDRLYKLTDTIKSTYFGKRKLVYAKLLAIITICICTSLLFIASITLHTYVTEGLGNWNANLSRITKVSNSYTIKQVYLSGCALLIIGSLLTGLCSALLSSLIKSSYASIVIALLITISPYFLKIPSAQFFPIQFMQYDSIYSPPARFELQNTVYFTKDIIFSLSWIPISSMMVVLINYYQTYHFIKE